MRNRTYPCSISIIGVDTSVPYDNACNVENIVVSHFSMFDKLIATQLKGYVLVRMCNISYANDLDILAYVKGDKTATIVVSPIKPLGYGKSIYSENVQKAYATGGVIGNAECDKDGHEAIINKSTLDKTYAIVKGFAVKTNVEVGNEVVIAAAIIPTALQKLTKQVNELIKRED